MYEYMLFDAQKFRRGLPGRVSEKLLPDLNALAAEGWHVVATITSGTGGTEAFLLERHSGFAEPS